MDEQQLALVVRAKKGDSAAFGELYEGYANELYRFALYMVGRPEDAEILLNRLLAMTVSYHDRQENFYHGFIAGLLAGTSGHECLSNREAGDGRPDIQLMAHDYSAAVVVEVKNAGDGSEDTMQKAAEAALRQSSGQSYERELQLYGYKRIHTYGIACFAKRCRILMAQEASGN